MTTTPADGELPAIFLSNANCSCRIYRFGAHVASLIVDGEEKLWMSKLSAMDGSAPIRGGIPIAFPQFADEGDLPALHGFARRCVWEVQSAGDDEAVFSLEHTESTVGMWPHKFALRYAVKLLERGLEVKLRVTNADDDGKPLEFTSCLHTYFLFNDTSTVELLGFKDSPYIDKVDGRRTKVQKGAVNVETEALRSAQDAGTRHGYVDRIYLDSPNEFEFCDLADAGRTLYKVTQSASWPDTTVYNPWLGDKQGERGPDFDDDGYKMTICCEPTISRAHAVKLEPGESWEGLQTIVVPAHHSTARIEV